MAGVEQEPTGGGVEGFAAASDEGVGEAEGFGQTDGATEEEDAAFLDAEGAGNPHAEDLGDSDEGFDDEGLAPGDGLAEEMGDHADFEGVEGPTGEVGGSAGEETGAMPGVKSGDGEVEVPERFASSCQPFGLPTDPGEDLLEGEEHAALLDPEEEEHGDESATEHDAEAGAESGNVGGEPKEEE